MKKQGNIEAFSSNQKYTNLAQSFLESPAISQNEVNCFHLGVDKENLIKTYAKTAPSIEELKKIPKFYKALDGTIKDYNNGKELTESFEKINKLLTNMQKEHGDKSFTVETRKEIDQTFREQWPTLTRLFDSDDKKTRLNNAKETIINDQNQEIKTSLEEFKKNSKLSEENKGTIENLLKQEDPQVFQKEVGEFIGKLDNISDKNLQAIKSIHEEGIKPRLENFGGKTNDYAQILGTINKTLETFESLSEKLKDAPTLIYSTTVVMQGEKPTKKEKQNALTKLIIEQQNITGLDPKQANFKKKLKKAKIKGKIEIVFENQKNPPTTIGYKISPKNLVKVLKKTDFNAIPSGQEKALETEVKNKTREDVINLLETEFANKTKIRKRAKRNQFEPEIKPKDSAPTLLNNEQKNPSPHQQNPSIIFPDQAKKILTTPINEPSIKELKQETEILETQTQQNHPLNPQTKVSLDQHKYIYEPFVKRFQTISLEEGGGIELDKLTTQRLKDEFTKHAAEFNLAGDKQGQGFAASWLKDKTPEQQLNILYSVSRDLGEETKTSPIIPALKLYMQDNNIASKEDLDKIVSKGVDDKDLVYTPQKKGPVKIIEQPSQEIKQETSQPKEKDTATNQQQNTLKETTKQEVVDITPKEEIITPHVEKTKSSTLDNKEIEKSIKELDEIQTNFNFTFDDFEKSLSQAIQTPSIQNQSVNLKTNKESDLVPEISKEEQKENTPLKEELKEDKSIQLAEKTEAKANPIDKKVTFQEAEKDIDELKKEEPQEQKKKSTRGGTQKLNELLDTGPKSIEELKEMDKEKASKKKVNKLMGTDFKEKDNLKKINQLLGPQELQPKKNLSEKIKDKLKKKKEEPEVTTTQNPLYKNQELEKMQQENKDLEQKATKTPLTVIPERNNKSQEELYVTDKDQQELNALFNENTGGQPIITNDTLNKKQNFPNIPEKDKQELNETLNAPLQTQKQPQKEQPQKETIDEFAQRILQDKSPDEQAYMLYAAVKNGKEDMAEALQNKMESSGKFTDVEIGEILLEGFNPKSQKFSKVLAANRLAELENAIDFKDERAEQKFHNKEESKKEETTLDSISVGDALEESNAPGLDEITAVIRTEILEKQHVLLVSAVVGATENEEVKAQISEMNPHQLREHLASPEGREVAAKVLNDKKVHKKLNGIEVAGYEEVHTRFQASFKNVEWAPGKENSRSTQIKNEQGELVADIKETTHNTEPKTVTLADGTTKTVSSYRTIDFPKGLETGKGPLHMSMAVKDENGKNIAANDAVYFTAHYDDNGKLTEVSSPQPVKFIGDGPDAVGYIERDGKVFTLPVTREKYQEMMQEVGKNQGMGVDLSQKVEIVEDKFKTEEIDINKFEPSKDPKDKQKNLEKMEQALSGKTPQEVVGIIKDQVEKGRAEVVELIVDATKPTRENKTSKVPQLSEKDYKTAYHQGMDKGAEAPDRQTQGNIHLAAVKLAKEGKIEPEIHMKKLELNVQAFKQEKGRSK